MKRLIKVTITQKLLETERDDCKGSIGQKVIITRYQWSDNERDAIGQSMAKYLNEMLLNTNHSLNEVLLEVKESYLKFEFYCIKGFKHVMGLSFTAE
jgi:hypothetical protein